MFSKHPFNFFEQCVLIHSKIVISLSVRVALVHKATTLRLTYCTLEWCHTLQLLSIVVSSYFCLSCNKVREQLNAHYSANYLLRSPAQQTHAGSLYCTANRGILCELPQHWLKGRCSVVPLFTLPCAPLTSSLPAAEKFSLHLLFLPLFSSHVLSSLIHCPLCPCEMHLWALLLLWLSWRWMFSFGLGVRNSDNHFGVFHTYEKTHTIFHTHIRVCDGAVCSLLSPHLFLHQAALRGGLASALVSKHQPALSAPLTLHAPPPPLFHSSHPLLYFPHSPSFHTLLFFSSTISTQILPVPFSLSFLCSDTVNLFFINLFTLAVCSCHCVWECQSQWQTMTQVNLGVCDGHQSWDALFFSV